MKLSPESIDGLIADKTFYTHETLTICVLELTNGALVTGESNVIDPANFDATIGKDVAFKDAREKIWRLEGYAHRTRGI